MLFVYDISQKDLWRSYSRHRHSTHSGQPSRGQPSRNSWRPSVSYAAGGGGGMIVLYEPVRTGVEISREKLARFQKVCREFRLGPLIPAVSQKTPFGAAESPYSQRLKGLPLAHRDATVHR